MKNRLQHIIKGNLYQGLEIFEVNNTRYYAFLKLVRKKQELMISAEGIFTDLDKLVACVDKKNPLVLVFNSSKVLLRKIPEATYANAEQWVAQAFPNLDLENFHFQVLDSKDIKVVSICKKTEITDLLNKLGGKGIVPSSISIGISELSNTLPYLNFPVQGSSFTIAKDDEEELEIGNPGNMDNGKIDLNGLILSNSSLLSFSGILATLNNSHGPSNLFAINQSLEYGFKNRKLFNLGLQIGLSSLLAILLLNFVLFSHYRSKMADLHLISSLENQSNLLNQTKERIAYKESKLNALINNSNSKVTYYLDTIGSSLPASILLDELDYQPLLKPVQKDKSIETIQNTIVVSGLTNNKDEFTFWANILEKMSWVKTVEIQNLEFVTNNLDRFTIKIEIHETGQ